MTTRPDPAPPPGVDRVALTCVVILLLPIVLAWVPAFLAWRALWGAVLRLWFWRAHRRHGRSVLFVYSDSPKWRAHVEEHVLPRLAGRAVVLNWSRRLHWPAESPWEAHFVRRFAGGREFNPVALVVTERLRVTPIRFYRAYLESRRGRQAALDLAAAELFELMGAAGPDPTDQECDYPRHE